MQISTEVRDIVALLDRFCSSGGKEDRGLRSADFFAGFLQHATDSGQMQKLGDLAFHGKYLWKLYGSLAKYPPGDEIRESVEREFTTALTSFRDMLDAFSAGGEDTFRPEVEARVLPLSGTALEVLMDLAHDFSWLKNWELEMQAEQSAAVERRDGGQAPDGNGPRGQDAA